MKTMNYSGPIEVITANLEPGEKLLESIKQIIKKYDIQNGFITSGAATLKESQMHHIEHTDFPPKDTFYTVEKPLEVGFVGGIVANSEPHLHMVVGYRDEKTWVGHVENDCIVCIFKFNGLHMIRHRDNERKINVLGPK